MSLKDLSIEELRDKAIELGIVIDGRWKNKKLIDEITAKSTEALINEIPQQIKVEAVEPAAPSNLAVAADLAKRIYEGQSSSLPFHIRKSRIIDRLKDKGYSDEIIKQIELLNNGR